MRRAGLNFTLFLFASASFAVGRATHTGHKELGTFTIAAVFPLSGSQAPYGQEALAGIHCALSELQRSDPGLAAHVRLETGDDESTQAGLQKTIDRLTKQRISLFIGSLSETSSQALVAQAHKQGIPVIIPSAVNLPLPSPSFPLVVRSSFPDSWQGHIDAQFARHFLKLKKAALLFDSAQTGARKMAESFAKAFTKAGGKIVATVHYHGGKLDFSTQLTTIAKAGAEAIMLPSFNGEEVTALRTTMKSRKLNLPLLGSDRWSSFKAEPDLYFPQHFSSELALSKVSAFVACFKEKQQRLPSALAAMSYDAFYLAVEALKKTSTLQGKDLHKSLSRLADAPGLLGPMRLSAEGFAEKSAAMMHHTPEGLRVHSVVGFTP
jgi:branched-chain amino acid transport system substrate-binding protein